MVRGRSCENLTTGQKYGDGQEMVKKRNHEARPHDRQGKEIHGTVFAGN